MKITKIIFSNNMEYTSVDYSQESHTWNINMHGKDWPWMMKIAKVKCAACGSFNVHKDGNYLKGGQRYQCQNKDCKRCFVIK